jgi:hypothetical protein
MIILQRILHGLFCEEFFSDHFAKHSLRIICKAFFKQHFCGEFFCEKQIADSLNNETRIILWTMSSPLKKDIILSSFFCRGESELSC